MGTMNYSVRRMREGDLRGVAELEAGVFTDWGRLHRRDPGPLTERTDEELGYAASFDPDGNLVAVAEEGAMAGFIFCRTWGRVGWFGTFGVPTQFQGLGIGTALMTRCLEYLRGRADVIGLETMPESGANVALYVREGFRLVEPTVLMELPLVRMSERLEASGGGEVLLWSRMDGSTRARTLGRMAAITDEHLKGLDLRREVEALHTRGLGETVLVRGRGGRLAGFALLRIAPYREGSSDGRAYIHALAVRRGAGDEEALADLLRGIWTVGKRRGFTRVLGGVQGRYGRAIGLMFDHGFRGVRTAVTMVDERSRREVFAESDAINFGRWAG